MAGDCDDCNELEESYNSVSRELIACRKGFYCKLKKEYVKKKDYDKLKEEKKQLGINCAHNYIAKCDELEHQKRISIPKEKINEVINPQIEYLKKLIKKRPENADRFKVALNRLENSKEELLGEN